MSAKKLTLNVSASLMKSYGCPLSFALRSVRGIASKRDSISAHFGKAFHKYKHALNCGLSQEKALLSACECFLDKLSVATGLEQTEVYSIDKLEATCRAYSKVYSSDPFIVATSNGKALSERPFSFLWEEDDLCQLNVQGTSDAIGSFYGTPCFCDIKTTSMAQKDIFLNAYQLSSQMFFYSWALGKVSPDFHGLPWFIDGVFLYKAKPAEFKRSQLFVAPHPDRIAKRIEESLEEIWTSLHGFARSKRTLSDLRYWFPPSGFINNACSGKFGSCVYFPLCSAPDEISEEQIAAFEYKQEPYEPLNH